MNSIYREQYLCGINIIFLNMSLSGGGPHRTLIGLIEYLIQSHNNANCVDPEQELELLLIN